VEAISLPACLSADRYIGPGRWHLSIRSFRRRSRTNFLGCVRRVLTVGCGRGKKKEYFAGAIYLGNESNLDTKDALPILTGFQEIPHEFVASRPGDPPALYANPSLARRVLDWAPELDLKSILRTAWKWETQGLPRLLPAVERTNCSICK
jgi:nucleoside-diphosphate-sugar epimerase